MLVRRLLEKYHTPYHDTLARHLQDARIQLMLDCHTMSEYPPPIAPDRQDRRPSVNLGDNDPQSCPREVTGILARSMAEAFELDDDEVSINRPFRGGYITRHHGSGPKPVIQVEINRALYFDETDPHRPAVAKLTRMNTMITRALQNFCERLARDA